MRFRADGEPLVAVGVPLPDGAPPTSRSTAWTTSTAACAPWRLTLLGGHRHHHAGRGRARLLGQPVHADPADPHRRGGRGGGRWASSTPAWTTTTTRDDPDLAPLVANFNGMVSALQERIDRDARFASDVSHELRSPLTTLNAGIQVLANNRDELPDRAQAGAGPAQPWTWSGSPSWWRTCSRSPASTPARCASSWTTWPWCPLVETTVANLTNGAVPVEVGPGPGGPGAGLRQAPAGADPGQLPQQRREVRGRRHRRVRRAPRARARRPDADESTVRIAVEDAGPGVPRERADQDLRPVQPRRPGRQPRRGHGGGPGPGPGRRARPAPGRPGVGRGPPRRGPGLRASWSSCPCSSRSTTEDEDDLSAATPEAASALDPHRRAQGPGAGATDDHGDPAR